LATLRDRQPVATTVPADKHLPRAEFTLFIGISSQTFTER
jgi:hypothetical protein